MTASRLWRLSLLLLWPLACCQIGGRGSATVATPYIYTPDRRTEDCIRALQDVYEKQGMPAFLSAKSQFAQSLLPFTRQDSSPDGTFDAFYFFVHPAYWSWKEPLSQDAVTLQSLILEIETEPSRAADRWQTLNDTVWGEWTGSGNPDLTRTVQAVLDLYAKIAGVPPVVPKPRKTPQGAVH